MSLDNYIRIFDKKWKYFQTIYSRIRWRDIHKFITYYFHPIVYKLKFFIKVKLGYSKLIVGSSNTEQVGWISSDIDVIDITKTSDWGKYFKTSSLSNIMAEHVLEHLSFRDGSKSVKNCYRYLEKYGKLRLAVPDGYHPSNKYIEYVSPTGPYRNVHKHRVLYNYKNLSKLLLNAGFEIKLIEYFDKSGIFHKSKWDINDGMITRSADFDDRNINGKLNYTSLIIDAIKRT